MDETDAKKERWAKERYRSKALYYYWGFMFFTFVVIACVCSVCCVLPRIVIAAKAISVSFFDFGCISHHYLLEKWFNYYLGSC